MKIAVCDDESKILEEIAAFIKKEFPGHKVEAFSDGETFLSAVKTATDAEPDLLLIDIDMPGMSGMDVAAALTCEKAHTLIVFVTAHDELVYDSFKYHPFAFVRKKFLDDELRSVIADCEKEIAGRNKHFIFQNASKMVNLAQSEILYFEGQANYLAIHTTSDEYKMRSTMAGVEKELEDSDFLRIHKGFLVNLEHIRVLKTEELELDNGTVLPIGKSYSEAAKKSILKYMRR
ncbi:two component transcriptional regulator, LytTR family [Treponema bryantii]|uniref:Two component transcriptional regulator, LytTR family n=1 Tax=Treponema bryantii TaxID=163 RepID=A0A1I3IBW6_9SPIR|nr:LytTR family DNA-binding domain-containing protein [Treponema bryantii]SFI45426.1 two component transcriptional regulator, LytTR family [Treponema bryantii]